MSTTVDEMNKKKGENRVNMQIYKPGICQLVQYNKIMSVSQIPPPVLNVAYYAMYMLQYYVKKSVGWSNITPHHHQREEKAKKL